MLPKCIVLVLVIAAVKSATLQGRNIPVEVRYEGVEQDVGSNFEEKIQLSQEEIKENNLRLQKLSIAEENLIPINNNQNFIRNFDEKVQLSPEELQQSSKHIPIDHDNQENDNWEALGELRENRLVQGKSDILGRVTLIEQAQDVVERGLQNLRRNFKPTSNEISPSTEDWDKLEREVKEYFVDETNKSGLRQEQVTQPQNIFQSIANGFQQVTNNFVQQFQGQIQGPSGQNGTSGDEGQAPSQQQNPIQGFIGYFTGGVQNIVSNIQNIAQGGPQVSGNSTVLGDSGTGDNQQPGNFIGNIVNNVQQLFQLPGNNQGVNGSGTQGDNPGGTQQGFFAGAISQINQVVSNIIPAPSQVPPAATQSDEGGSNPAPIQPSGPIQQVVQSIGSIGTAFNQFIQGGPPQNKPQGSEDENAGSQPQNQNFIQSIGQNIGNAFQNIQNQFRPPSPSGSTEKPGAESSNPIIGQVSNIGNQLQQIAGQGLGTNPIQNLIPGSSSSTDKKPAEEKPETPTESDSPSLGKTEKVVQETVNSEKNEEFMTITE